MTTTDDQYNIDEVMRLAGKSVKKTVKEERRGRHRAWLREQLAHNGAEKVAAGVVLLSATMVFGGVAVGFLVSGLPLPMMDVTDAAFMVALAFVELFSWYLLRHRRWTEARSR